MQHLFNFARVDAGILVPGPSAELAKDSGEWHIMASGLRGSAGLTGQGQQVFKRGSTSLEHCGARDSVGTSHVGCCHPGPSRWIYSDLLESGPSADGHTQNFTAEDSLARRGCVVASPLVTVATHPRERGGCFELYCPAFLLLELPTASQRVARSGATWHQAYGRGVSDEFTRGARP